MTSPEAAPRTPSGQELQALLRKVPTHSGAEYRNWIALLVKAEAEAAAGTALDARLSLMDDLCLYSITPLFRCNQRRLHSGNHQSDPGESLADIDARLRGGNRG